MTKTGAALRALLAGLSGPARWVHIIRRRYAGKPNEPWLFATVYDDHTAAIVSADTVRASGGRAMVVTAWYEPSRRVDVLALSGWQVDEYWPLERNALSSKALQIDGEYDTPWTKIARETAKEYGIRPIDILSRKTGGANWPARRMCVHIFRNVMPDPPSYPAIASMLGRGNHVGVMRTAKSMAVRAASDPSIAAIAHNILNRCNISPRTTSTPASPSPDL